MRTRWLFNFLIFTSQMMFPPLSLDRSKRCNLYRIQRGRPY